MQFIISLAVFVLFLVGLIIVSNIHLEDMSSDMDSLMNPAESIRKRAYKKQKNKKEGFFIGILKDTKLILSSMGQSNKFIIICILSVILSFMGAIVTVLLGNPFLIPAFAIGFLSLPFIFVRTYSYAYQKHLRNELELSLSQITISYLRTDDILKSVEENLMYTNPPVRNVFEEFLYQVKFINPNIRQAIDDMSEKIDNRIFREWCDALKRCNQNRTLKYMLQPIVDKFATLREVGDSIQEALNGYKMEFFIIVGIVYFNYPLVWFMEKSWYEILSTTTLGLATTGVIALVTVICSIILSFILKPLDYDI